MRRAALMPCVFGILLAGTTFVTSAQQPGLAHNREFVPGSWRDIEELPPGKLKNGLERLSPPARTRAMEKLQQFQFPHQDAEVLDVDPSGGVFYADEFTLDASVTADESTVITGEASVPTGSLPANLLFHSKPGSQNILYLNFCGETVTGTAWNTSLGRTSIPALPFSTDTDFTTFSDSEQLAIKRIWQRVSEDYAPFDIRCDH